jgi:hypothetical protein
MQAKIYHLVAATAAIEPCKRSGPKNPLIGFLSPGPAAFGAARFTSFREGLRHSGWNDGQVEIAARSAENEAERNRLLANELVELKPIVVLLDPASPSPQKASSRLLWR